MSEEFSEGLSASVNQWVSEWFSELDIEQMSDLTSKWVRYLLSECEWVKLSVSDSQLVSEWVIGGVCERVSVWVIDWVREQGREIGVGQLSSQQDNEWVSM